MRLLATAWLTRLLALLIPLTAAQSTTVIAVTATATTTVTQTATNTEGAQGACNNFYGACVVYGGPGNPSYTTTIYATGNPTTYYSGATTLTSP